MAITITNIPVLKGDTAEEFVRSADENAMKATPRLSDSAKKQLQKVLEMMIASCSHTTRKCVKIAFLSVVVWMTLTTFSSMMPICMRKSCWGKLIVG